MYHFLAEIIDLEPSATRFEINIILIDLFYCPNPEIVHIVHPDRAILHIDKGHSRLEMETRLSGIDYVYYYPLWLN